MLEKIEIKNFQSHVNTIIEPHEGITAIAGSSRHGKSAIFRAINWVVANKPIQKFDKYITFDELKKGNATKVSLTFDGVKVSRKKSKSVNGYTLDSKKFDVVGSNVPDEVQKFINLNETNIQSQHGDYFLIQNTSPGEVAKRLNKVAGLEIIDFVAKEVKSKITENGSKLKHHKEHLEGLEANIKKFEYLDTIEELLTNLNKSVALHITKFNEKEKLEKALEELINAKEFISDISSWLEVEKDLNVILTKLASVEKLNTDTQNLKKLLTNVVCTENTIKKLKDKIITEKEVKLIMKLINEFYIISKDIDTISNILTNVKGVKIKVNKYNLIVKEKTEELNNKLKEYKLCPFCGSKITDNSIEHIKKHLG